MTTYPVGERLRGDIVLYRIIAGRRARQADFQSPGHLGRPRPPSFDAFEGSQTDPHQAVSMWATAVQAAQRTKPGSGQHIARLLIPERAASADIIVRRTGTREGHFDVWGRDKRLLACATAILTRQEALAGDTV